MFDTDGTLCTRKGAKVVKANAKKRQADIENFVEVLESMANPSMEVLFSGSGRIASCHGRMMRQIWSRDWTVTAVFAAGATRTLRRPYKALFAGALSVWHSWRFSHVRPRLI